MTTRPPRLAALLVQWLVPPYLAEPLLGDLEQEFHRIAVSRGGVRSGIWYWREALRAASSLSCRISADESDNTRGDGAVSTILTDARQAMRAMLRQPAFTVPAVLTAALGIGATTAIFSAVNPILFQSLPYPDANQIAMIWEQGANLGDRSNTTYATARDLSARSHSFARTALVRGWQPTMTSAGEPERFTGQRVGAEYFRVLGIAPALGRGFQPSDDILNGPAVVVLSDGLWRRRFGADPTIVGRNITLNENSYLVIGVMPKTFENVLSPAAELWAPLQYDASLQYACRTCRHLRLVGRLNAGVTAADANRELDGISHALVTENPKDYPREGFIVNRAQDDVIRAVRPALYAVVGAVALLLLIACVNITNLLLARSAQRSGEFAVRTALGAARPRIIRQLLTESLLLSAIAGVLGIGIAQVGVRSLVALSPSGLPRVNAIHVNAGVLAFALLVTATIGIVVGVLPAMRATRVDLGARLQRTSRRTVGGMGNARSVLVVAQVAVALMLLTGSGLLLRSLTRLLSVSPGFAPENVLSMQVQTAGKRFAEDSTTWRFFAQSLEAVQHVPGVTAAAFTSQLPLSGDFDSYGMHFETVHTDNPQEDQSAFRYAVSPGYFATMGIVLRRGRLLDEHDVASSPGAVLINESFARRKFPAGNALGQHVHVGADTGPWYTIVGIVGDVKQQSLAADQSDAVYVTPTQWQFSDNALTLVVRSSSDPAALAPSIRRAIWSIDKDQPIMRVAPMLELVESSTADRRFVLILFEAFALVAVVLAAAGIYGLLSGMVTERRREIGVRSALGASRMNILGMVMREGLTLTLAGALIGTVAALAGSRLVQSLLFGISRADPTTYAVVLTVLLVVAIPACWLPAWRATRIDPAVALRAD